MQKKLVTAVLALLLVPALAAAQKTSYDYNKAANFTAFKTYALKDGTNVGQPLIDDRIVAAIDTQLAAKGFTKSRSTPMSSSCITSPSTSRRTSPPTAAAMAAATARTAGAGAAAGPGVTSTQVRDILVGTLVIDIADAKKKQVAWRGMGVKEVHTQASPEKRDKSINEAVKKIFKNYPPKIKK